MRQLIFYVMVTYNIIFVVVIVVIIATTVDKQTSDVLPI